MKTNLFKNAFIACLSIALFAVVISGCSKTDTPATKADQTKLTALVDSCTSLLASSTVATDYPAAAITAFQTVLTNTKTAALSTTITQSAVDNLAVNLRAAKTTFLAAAYGAIPTTALLMGMTFDETVASNQFTTEGKGWTAKLTAGASQVFGTNTGMPTFVTGKVGKAIHFGLGSHLEVSDYNAGSLQGSQLSVSVWVKPDSTRAGNYIMSYNYWNSWKFNLQEANKPFFTVTTAAGGTDADNEGGGIAANGTWTQLVVSMNLTTGTLTFYINGMSTMVWATGTDKVKPNLSGVIKAYGTVLPLMIGACTTYAEVIAKWDWVTPPIKPQGWDYFIGSMDELKVYNVALTDGQVAKLYKDENK